MLLVGCGVSKESTIWIAAADGDIHTVELLIALGQDVNATDEWGTTPLHSADVNCHKDIVELLITKGSDVNAKTGFGEYKGQTPLDAAINFKKTETADLLRKHGGKTGEELKAEGK